jgi:hypothetical protein
MVRFLYTYLFKIKVMSVKKEDASVEHQPHSRQEGQQNNIRPNDQQFNDTNAQPMSNMMQESEEQKAGRAQGQKDEGPEQQQERRS